VVSSRICLANGRISLVRTCRIPLVSALATAISDVTLDAVDHRLDGQHNPHVRSMALARTWASMGSASRLGNAGGIRMRGNGLCRYRIPPDHTATSAILNERGRVRFTASDSLIRVSLTTAWSSLTVFFQFRRGATP
jgi:hypothetical protein